MTYLEETRAATAASVKKIKASHDASFKKLCESEYERLKICIEFSVNKGDSVVRFGSTQHQVCNYVYNKIKDEGFSVSKANHEIRVSWE